MTEKEVSKTLRDFEETRLRYLSLSFVGFLIVLGLVVPGADILLLILGLGLWVGGLSLAYPEEAARFARKAWRVVNGPPRSKEMPKP